MGAGSAASATHSRDEYVGQPAAKFHVDPGVLAGMLVRLARGERVTGLEARLKCKDGSLKTVRIDSSAFRVDGRFVHSQCFTSDVTRQLAAERAGQHLAAIVESSDDAVISKDLHGVVRSWNRAAERLFGYAPGEIIGRSITMLIPEGLQDQEAMILARIRAGERVEHFETLRRRKDGSLVDVSLSISPIRDARGEIVGASKIARDITETRRTQDALREATAALERSHEALEARVRERTASLQEAVAQMEEFSYTVSHDLRAPLRAMQAYSKALQEDFAPVLGPHPDARQYLAKIADNAKRLDRMILDVLTFSRVSRSELRMSTVALDRLVRETIEHYPGMQAPRAQVRVEPLHDVLGHEPSLIQAVSNLLTNSVKFVGTGETPRVRVWTEASGGKVRLSVQDAGIGIEPEHHDRLFKMFERIHPDLPYEGTGVGLAIVKRAVERMGGKVGVESRGDGGSRFWIELAAAETA